LTTSSRVPRTGRSLSKALLLVLLFSAAGGARAETDLRFLPAYFTGDFGGDIPTDIAFAPLVLTVQSRRNEFRGTVPFLSIRTDQSVVFIGGEVIPTGGGPQTESGLGDVILQDDYYFKQGSARAPWLYGSLRIKLPTGDETKGLGSGKTDIGPGAGIIQPLGTRWSLLSEVRYVFRGDPSGVDFRNTLWIDAGAQVRPSQATWLSFFYDRRESVLADRVPIEDVSAEFDVRLSPAVKLRSAVFKGLSDTAEDYGLSLGFSVQLSPRTKP
jgi:outer membrane putative beta-barrel porin/alpha-amylase